MEYLYGFLAVILAMVVLRLLNAHWQRKHWRTAAQAPGQGAITARPGLQEPAAHEPQRRPAQRLALGASSDRLVSPSVVHTRGQFGERRKRQADGLKRA